MSKEIYDKYGNEIVKLEVKYNDKLQSICMNCFRIGGVKWNDIDNGSFLTLTLNKKDLIDQLVENEVKFDFDEDDDGETVKQVIVDDEKYIDIEYFAKIKADLEAKLAEKEEEIKVVREQNGRVIEKSDLIVRSNQELEKENQQLKEELKKPIQDKISFAVAYLEIIKAFIIDKEFYFMGEDYSTVYVEDITEEIDNQIEQLKEGK